MAQAEAAGLRWCGPQEEGAPPAKPGGWFPFGRAREAEAGPPKEYLYSRRLGMPVVRERLSYNDLLRDIR